jgi:hypothetical protein
MNRHSQAIAAFDYATPSRAIIFEADRQAITPRRHD